jgi:hypothetical protein
MGVLEGQMSYKLRNVSASHGMVNLPDSVWQYANWNINDELELIVTMKPIKGELVKTIEIIRTADFPEGSLIDAREEEE